MLSEFNPDTARLALFLGGFALFLGVESIFLRRPRQRSLWSRLAFHGGIAIANTLLLRFLVAAPFLAFSAWVSANEWGLAHLFGLGGGPEILVSVLVLDGFNYAWHRANHRVRFLWRFHKAHHSDPEMDVTTALRFHPGELLISAGVKGVWILVWGPSAAAWFAFEVLVSFAAQFHHSDIDFPEKVEATLSHLLVTPRYHAAHHAVDRRFGDRNFATILTLWDRAFGSYAKPAPHGATTAAPGSIGLAAGRASAFSPRAFLLEPVDGLNMLPADNRADSRA